MNKKEPRMGEREEIRKLTPTCGHILHWYLRPDVDPAILPPDVEPDEMMGMIGGDCDDELLVDADVVDRGPTGTPYKLAAADEPNWPTTGGPCEIGTSIRPSCSRFPPMKNKTKKKIQSNRKTKMLIFFFFFWGGGGIVNGFVV